MDWYRRRSYFDRTISIPPKKQTDAKKILIHINERSSFVSSFKFVVFSVIFLYISPYNISPLFDYMHNVYTFSMYTSVFWCKKTDKYICTRLFYRYTESTKWSRVQMVL